MHVFANLQDAYNAFQIPRLRNHIRAGVKRASATLKLSVLKQRSTGDCGLNIFVTALDLSEFWQVDDATACSILRFMAALFCIDRDLLPDDVWDSHWPNWERGTMAGVLASNSFTHHEHVLMIGRALGLQIGVFCGTSFTMRWSHELLSDLSVPCRSGTRARTRGPPCPELPTLLTQFQRAHYQIMTDDSG